MAITYVANNYAGGGSTTASLNVPTGTQNNDLMFAIIQSGGSPGSITPSTGWTYLTSNAATNNYTYVYWKQAYQEGSAYTWTISSTPTYGWNIAIVTYRGASIAFDAYEINNNSSNSSIQTANSITTSNTNDTLLVVIGTFVTTAASSYTWSGGLTSRLTYGGGAADTCGINIADVGLSSSGATGNYTLNIGTGSATSNGLQIALQPTALAPAITSTTFNYTGATQNYTVPAGVTQVMVDAYGGSGGSGGANGGGSPGGEGGYGGRTTAIITTTPGETLTVYVGGNGGAGGQGTGGTAGWGGCTGGAGGLGNWGSNLGGGGGGGGGSTEIRRSSTRLVVASGGGGGGGEGGSSTTLWGIAGGAGGGLVGLVNSGGGGGTQVAGGASGGGTSTAGSSTSGGTGGGNGTNISGGGGGGGGYYGGGGGAEAGAGAGGSGGSSYAINQSLGYASLSTGASQGNGYVTIYPITNGCVYGADIKPPYYISTASNTMSSGTGTSMTVGVPTGTQQNDVMVAFAAYASSTITAPSGWALESSQTTGSWITAAYVKTAGASESSTTWSWSASVAATVAISSYRNSSGSDAAAGTNTTASGNNFSMSSVTTTTNPDLLIAGAGGVPATWAITQSGFTQRVGQSTNAGLVVADNQDYTTGASTTVSGTVSSSGAAVVGVLVALKPLTTSGSPSWTVPAGVSALNAIVDGGAGSWVPGNDEVAGTQSGGQGCRVSCTIQTTPGDTLNFYIGKSPGMGGTTGGWGWAAGGAYGAPSGTYASGAAGGGATGIVSNTNGLLVAAAGGGGGGGPDSVDMTGTSPGGSGWFNGAGGTWDTSYIDNGGYISYSPAALSGAGAGGGIGTATSGGAGGAGGTGGGASGGGGGGGGFTGGGGGNDGTPAGAYTAATSASGGGGGASIANYLPICQSIVTNSNTTASNSSFTINKPSFVNNGTLMIAVIGANQNTASTPSGPTGWTMITSNNPDSATSLSVWYKIAGGSEPTSYTWTSGAYQYYAGWIGSFSGALNSGTPYDVYASHTGATTAPPSMTSPSVTTTSDYEFILQTYGLVGGGGFATPFPNAGASILGSSISAGSAIEVAVCGAYQIDYGTTQSYTGNSAATGYNYGALTVAFKPTTAPLVSNVVYSNPTGVSTAYGDGVAMLWNYLPGGGAQGRRSDGNAGEKGYRGRGLFTAFS